MASAQDLWQSIRREAEEGASRDHILGNSLQKSILVHPDLGSALALQIGERLGARDEDRARFTRVASEAFAASPDLVELPAAISRASRCTIPPSRRCCRRCSTTRDLSRSRRGAFRTGSGSATAATLRC